MTVAAVPPRSEVPREQTWDLESMFPTVAAWETAFGAAEAMLPGLSEFVGKLGADPASLLAALRAADAVSEAVEKVAVYAILRRAEDAGNARAAAIAERAQGLSARAAAAASFIAPEIAAIPETTLNEWFATEPGLAQYRYAIARIRRQHAHIRSTEVERVLAQAGEVMDSFETIHDMLENGELPLGAIRDADGADVALAQGNVDRYLHSPDRRVRREAWEQSADAYLDFQNTFAATLAGAVKRDVFSARAHNFDSALAAALSGDNIPTTVFHTLLDVVWEHFPLWQRYFRARRKLLGLPAGDLHGYDLEAPLAPRQPAMNWQRGVDVILDALAPLGPEYVAAVRQGLADRWVDRCANLGKGGGAFSWGCFGAMPFISMTWQDNLTSVSTLIHELGHSMHSYFTWQNQPVTYANYGMSAAETASNFNQALMGARLLEMNDERDWTLAVIEERMENFQRYLFIMPILARFELVCHERVERGEALDAAWMNETLLGFYREGYGDAVVIDPERMGVTWARFPHLFMNFYVFQYGLGIAAAAALAVAILGGDEAARDRYLAFLATGGSQDPIDALRAAGIDLSSPDPIRRAFTVLEGYVAKLEELAG
ncbi:MAG: oligoendopeptidase F [Thermomicrobiales bacterium]|nr:oligoendopeptidase F [Thermomicrobiales bacterium]